MTTTTITPPRLASDAEGIAAAHEAAGRIARLARDASFNDSVPHEAAEILSASGITSIYVPREFGGIGASIETVVETVRIISAADGGVGQLLQIHNVMIRGVFSRADDEFRARLIADIFAGKRFGNALAEGKGKGKGGGTRLSRDQRGVWRLNGRKTFATGCYLAEWISISATSDDGPVGVLLNRDTPGLTLEDDWDAYGQQHSVSGSVSFDNIEVDPRFAPKANTGGGSPDFMPRTGLTWPQILHAAIDTGIARGALDAATAYIRDNMRAWPEAGVDRAADEQYTIKRIGEYAVAVRAAESALRYAARTFDHFKADPGNRALEDELILATATARAQSDEASVFIGSDLFSLTGANSTLDKWNLQRFWADARVHTTHDPIRWRIYHIGNYYLNGIPPDEYGRAARLRQQEIAIATNSLPAPNSPATEASPS
ncbi:acyl-CoA dehydrogenase family protein [Novosphingobium sp. P6W]|uniref:acyl-CoA dehydrogenase family protein n=1 Tax=Novosphingobium sp. P6W TaxID=1609758 RepID=UPI0005C30931|nr:acyl-CoA dehydrogenase family protein [Novosphingobium sp. P6W]AXB78514.1 monooxygenase [Novosphingobium sp. P6W]KIS30596.1 monooxygenase [Novosphingobium sp. P6W]